MTPPQTLSGSVPRHPEIELDRITMRVLGGLSEHDPRVPLVAGWVAEAAARLEAARVRRHAAVLIERAVRHELRRPHAAARARWRRRTPCELRMSKWDGSPARRVPLRFEGRDRFGRWYRWPAGEATLPRAGPPRTFASDFVQLVPDTGSWTARWGDDGEVELYCDVTTRPVVTAEVTRDDTVTAVDLDLDVVRRHDGRVEIIDQDQFAQRRREMGYPSAVVAEALATAEWLHTQLVDRIEPFGHVGARILARQDCSRPAENGRSGRSSKARP